MEIINQTNRSILFEEINPEKLDLLSLVGDTKGIDSLDDEKIKEINEKLLIKNFDEFLDKFEPVVYSFYNASNQKVVYTLKKPENLPEEHIVTIPINRSNDFLNMLFTLIETKTAQGIANVDFKFENLLDMISPKKVMDDIRQSRKEIQYVYSKYEELDEEDPKKLDLGDKLNYMFEDASNNYNNVMAMLPLAIEDIKTRLLLGDGSTLGDDEELKLGILSMGEGGELKILEAPKEQSTDLVALDDNANTGLIAAFEDDYDSINEAPSEYVKDLVVRTFCPLTSTLESSIDIEKEVNNYNTYLEFYKTAKDDFVKAVKPLIEKIVGIKMFFDQYNTETRGMKPSLIITNNKLDMTVKSSNLPRLTTYLNTVNDKNDFDNTIWFGIVPSVQMQKQSQSKLKRMRFKGNNKKEKEGMNTLESVTMLLNSLKDYKIQTFFSFETGEETTFSNMAVNGIDKYVDLCENLMKKDYSEYAIPCMPNFTIIPKDKSGVILDSKMKLSEKGLAKMSKEKEDILKLWIEGVYIDASYVAAGIVAAYQCPEYLKDTFKLATPKYPGVRFDIEANDYALRFKTTLAKEISGFTNSIKNSINRKSFGFVFSSENAQFEGREIRQITVYKARSLQLNGNDFDSIYKTLMSSYIERVLRFHTNDFKQDNIVKFFSNNPSSQKSKWLSDKGYINSIIQDGDDINFNIDEKTGCCNIDITFNGTVKNLEVEITRNDAVS
ncbi:transcriptional regulator [Peptostreptococcaceae bacterium AGR-M142]